MADGSPAGESNPNPILDTRTYELEFPEGRIEEYAVNVIAENLLNQADADGWDTGLLEEILDARRTMTLQYLLRMVLLNLSMANNAQ